MPEFHIKIQGQWAEKWQELNRPTLGGISVV
jgi:hypothetical protein